MLLGGALPNLMMPAAAKAAHAAQAARAAKEVGTRAMDVVRAPAVLGIRGAGKGVHMSGGLNLPRTGRPRVEVTVNGMTLITID